MQLYHINQSVVDESALDDLRMARTEMPTCWHAFQFDIFDDPFFFRCFKHVLKMCYNVLHSQMFPNVAAFPPAVRIPRYVWIEKIWKQSTWRPSSLTKHGEDSVAYLDTVPLRGEKRFVGVGLASVKRIYDTYAWYVYIYIIHTLTLTYIRIQYLYIQIRF